MSTDREQWIREQAEAEFPYYPQDQFDLTDPDDHRTYTRMKSDMNYKREGFIAGAKWLQSQCPSAPQGDNWISVKESGFPEKEAWYIVGDEATQFVSVAFYYQVMGFGRAWVTHYQPLPLPPSRSVKGGNNQNE
jgi:hypothetical protein